MSPSKPLRRASAKSRKPTSPAKSVGLRRSVESSVAAMPWLKPSDQASVDLALAYATQIDAAVAGGDSVEVTKALYLGPHLLNTLRSLGGAPAERKALAVEEVVGGKLAQLRSVAAGPKAG